MKEVKVLLVFMINPSSTYTVFDYDLIDAVMKRELAILYFLQIWTCNQAGKFVKTQEYMSTKCVICLSQT